MRSAPRFSIHEGQPGDSAEIAALGVLVWRVAYRGILPDDVLEGLDPEARRPRIIASFETGSVWHIARDGRHNMVGFVQGRPADKHADWEMNALYVHPEWQRQGVGRALQLALVASIQRRGGRSLSVFVLARNHRAKKFYVKHGARLVGADTLDVREKSYLLDIYLYESLSRLKRSLQAGA